MKNQLNAIPNLENGKAFQHKNQVEIWRALMLFYSAAYLPAAFLNSKLLNNIWQNFLPAREFMRLTAFAQFCGGESLLECQQVVEDLNKQDIFSILDFSAESMHSELDFEKTTQEVLNTIQWASQDKRISYAVFKPTSIIKFALLEKKQANQPLTPSEQADWQKGYERFKLMCKEAYQKKVPLFVDAEESWIQDPIDQWVEEASALYNQESVYIFNTLQMYRHDRLTYLKNIHQKSKNLGFKLGFKIVRGAYLEKENSRAQQLGITSPLQPSKQATDTAYDEAVAYCLHQQGDMNICLGTHNIESIFSALQLMQQLKIEPSSSAIHFAQLYGMSDPITHYLASIKANVSKYVPYGPIQKVLPYLVRRLQENKGVAGQINRELNWVKSELKRRLGVGN